MSERESASPRPPLAEDRSGRARPRAGARVARRLALPACAVAIALGVAACGGTESSTGSYKGEKAKVAEAISSLQSDATAGDAKKVCSKDLAASVGKRLEASGGTCVKALESQLREVDTFNLTVESIEVKGAQATAKVKSTWSGKLREKTLSLVREGGSWKVDSLS